MRKKKAKERRELNLKDFLEKIIPTHSVLEERLNEFYGKGNWRRMPDEVYKRLRHELESWTVEVYDRVEGTIIRGTTSKAVERNPAVG